MDRLAKAAGFILSVFLVFNENWTVRQFCWSFWLSALFYCWFYGALACARMALGTQTAAAIKTRIPAFAELHALWQRLALLGGAALLAAALFWLYAYMFSFYGIFLSVFAEMEPLALFGRNGFINSDFFTPVAHLARLYWPLAAAVIAADLPSAFGKPALLLAKPFSAQVAALHITIVALPFISLIAWAVFKDNWQQPVLAVLLAGYYFAPALFEKKSAAATA